MHSILLKRKMFDKITLEMEIICVGPDEIFFHGNEKYTRK